MRAPITEAGRYTPVAQVRAPKCITVTKQPATADKFKHLVDKDGKWAGRDDVFFHYLERKGKLTAGFGIQPDPIGPELGFGRVVADAYEEPVLRVKLAWGAGAWPKTSARPAPAPAARPGRITPRSDHSQKGRAERPQKGVTGVWRPRLRTVRVRWHPGWNDSVNQAFVDEHENYMAHFIRDVRNDLGVKDLPFVIADTGVTGPDGISQCVHSD